MTINKTPAVVSIIIPTWNRRDEVLACLDSLLRQKEVMLEIIVVDDGSIDDTVAAIRSRFPGVTVLTESKHYGISFCRNLGILASHGEYIQHLDSDTEMPDEYVISRMVRMFEKTPGLGILGGVILPSTGRTDAAYGLNRGPRGHPVMKFITSADGLQKCDWVVGCNMMARRTVVFQVGGFDLNFEFGFDDTSFSIRVSRAGYTNYISYDCSVYHKPSNSGRRPDESYRYCLTSGRLLIKYYGMPAFCLTYVKNIISIAGSFAWLPVRWIKSRLSGRRMEIDAYRSKWGLIRAYAWDLMHWVRIRSTREMNFLDAGIMRKYAVTREQRRAAAT